VADTQRSLQPRSRADGRAARVATATRNRSTAGSEHPDADRTGDDVLLPRRHPDAGLTAGDERPGPAPSGVLEELGEPAPLDIPAVQRGPSIPAIPAI
jgi:hypothetical protein